MQDFNKIWYTAEWGMMMNWKEIIRENLIRLRERIAASGKEPVLVAVSKNMPAEAILAAYELGIRDFGENRVQEMLEKQDKLPSDIRWHFIGNIQKNKLKYLCGKTYLVHSVSSYELAEEFSSRLGRMNKTADVLVEIKTSREKTKGGINFSEAVTEIDKIIRINNINFLGLMTMAPLTEDENQIRESFSSLKKLRISVEQKLGIRVKYLSMGMSDDFEIALFEGSDMIRVGRGIFGERRSN